MIIRLTLIFLLSFSLTACWASEKVIHWKQEVKLQDRRIIIVDRISTEIGPGFPEHVTLETSQILSFSNPNTQEKITWKIPKGLLPYSLAFDKNIPYLVLKAYTVADYNNWNCPNPPYMVYRYENKKWSAIPFNQLPEKITSRNLVDMSSSLKPYSEDNFMSLNEVEAWLNDVQEWRRKEYRTISRRLVSSIAEGCFGSTLYKLGRESEINYRR